MDDKCNKDIRDIEFYLTSWKPCKETLDKWNNIKSHITTLEQSNAELLCKLQNTRSRLQILQVEYHHLKAKDSKLALKDKTINGERV